MMAWKHGDIRFLEKRSAYQRGRPCCRRPEDADVKVAFEELADLIFTAGFGEHAADVGMLATKRLHQRRQHMMRSTGGKSDPQPSFFAVTEPAGGGAEILGGPDHLSRFFQQNFTF